tara:strand:+ start:9663 stop:10091 length:429 start_codon:yes stop_codon:yes gene_type:complete
MGVKNQLFKRYPSKELFMGVLNAFGIYDLEEGPNIFSRNDLVHLKTVEKIVILKPYLEKCYIPCKARTYLNNLTEKNVITILRQLLKTKGYSIASKEKYTKGYKFIIYTVKPNENIEYIPITPVQPDEKHVKSIKPIIVTFN